MTLAATERDRLADVQELEPTTNAELIDRWDMDSGSEVAAYLRNKLGEHVYRDENSKIRTDTDAPTDRDTDAEDVKDTTSEEPDAADPQTNTKDSLLFGSDTSEENTESNTVSDTQTPTEETPEANDGGESHNPAPAESLMLQNCPFCDMELTDPNEGDIFYLREKRGIIRREHKWVYVEGDDRVCTNCDILFDPDGETHAGSEYSPPANA